MNTATHLVLGAFVTPTPLHPALATSTPHADQNSLWAVNVCPAKVFDHIENASSGFLTPERSIQYTPTRPLADRI